MAPKLDTRIFLGLDQPPLVSAVDWLVRTHRFEKSDTIQLDLSQFIIVVPTARAQHRLLQLLVAGTDVAHVQLTPPIITTLGKFPEYLYAAEKALATELTQQIAWSKALESTPEEEIRKLTGRADVEDLRDWQPLANMISKLHMRLANDIWSFSSVAREVANLSGFLQEETVRWEVLASIQRRYYALLAGANLWDKQAARNYAAGGLLKANEIRCRTDKQVVMLATADLNRSVSEMLRQIKTTNPSQVYILIAAPESLADRFDEFGSLITQQWLNVPIEIGDRQILITDQPADQAAAATHFVTHLDGDFAADEITIGVPDESVVPQLQRSLHAIDVEHRHLAGRPLSETSPVYLLEACREYMHSYSYDALASLVRHPDMFHWLVETLISEGVGDAPTVGEFLTDLAVYQNSNLPDAIRLDEKHPFGDPEKISQRFDPTDGSSKKRAQRHAQAISRLNQVHQKIARLLLPLAASPRPIAAWTQPWNQLLTEIYGGRLLGKNDSTDRQIIAACNVIATALNDQQQVPDSLGTITTSTQALQWALQAAAGHRVVSPPFPTAIELAGWLDLALDDAPVMVVTGMNDEHVPTAEVGHQFVPNELCKQLGILDNDRRFARDCYALLVITSVRKNLLLIAGRHDDQGEPLKPSRLLFADDAQTAARRAKAFFSYQGKSETPFWLYARKLCHNEQQFQVPLPVCTKPVTQISVTKFRDFIKCPYRFYLNHILRLEAVTDDWRELVGGIFGDLKHIFLEAFGKSDLRDTTDVGQIYEFLNDQLNTFVAEQFSGSRLPAVRVQIEQLRLRFERFAIQQAQRRQDRWRIVSTEEMLEHDFEVDGSPFRIRGKIDRVDQHEVTNQIAVWDYKSSDKGDPPEKVHYAKRKKEWKDLQLPLYRHLVKEVSAVSGADFSDVLMGYILLPRNLDNVGFHEANWTAEELNSADEVAKDIVRQIRRAQFWPLVPEPPLYSEEFSAICQDNVFEKRKRVSLEKVAS